MNKGSGSFPAQRVKEQNQSRREPEIGQQGRAEGHAKEQAQLEEAKHRGKEQYGIAYDQKYTGLNNGPSYGKICGSQGFFVVAQAGELLPEAGEEVNGVVHRHPDDDTGKTYGNHVQVQANKTQKAHGDKNGKYVGQHAEQAKTYGT